MVCTSCIPRRSIPPLPQILVELFTISQNYDNYDTISYTILSYDQDSKALRIYDTILRYPFTMLTINSKIVRLTESGLACPDYYFIRHPPPHVLQDSNDTCIIII